MMRPANLFVLVGCTLLGLVSEASAQTAGDEPVLEEILVTGTRIARDGYSTPTPVTVADTEDLLAVTPTNIPDALNKLPQFQLSSSPAQSLHNFANTAQHGNLLNLRGVGSQRTLILLDGVRMPKTTYLGDVDVNVIPNMLVERTEIVTGGASAAYGSDAISGVVNFILDKDFTGYKGKLQSGMDAEGNNEHTRLGFAGGWEFADGAGHLLLSAERYDHDGMLRGDRELSREGWIFAGSNPNCTSTVPGACVPGGAENPYVRVPDGRLTVSHKLGLINGPAGFPFQGYRFLPSGDITPFDPGTPTGSPIFASGGDGYTIPFDVSGVAPLTTDQLFARGEYQFADITAHVQGIYSNSEVTYISLANSWTGVTPAPIFSGNPFIPDEVQAAMGPDDAISVVQNPIDGVNPRTKEDTEFWMLTFGLDGGFGDDWQWSLTYSHGDSKHTTDQSRLFNWQRSYAAIDAVRDGSGNIVCRPSLSSDSEVAARFADCRPMNIMGVEPSAATPEGFAYATGTSSYQAETSQDQVAFELTGSLFSVPAGEVDLAVGVEWRNEDLKLESNADPALLDEPEERAEHFAGLRGVSSSALFFWLTNVGIADGDADVTEAFAEVNVPILSDQPGFREFDLNGTVRYTDYSTSGSVDTWKLGLTWRPVEDVLLRATKSQDIRAPSLFDLFAGDQSAIGTVFDPVSGGQQNIPQITGGNPDLVPEEADSLTVGAVFTPSFAPSLSLAVDYYEIEIDGAIGTLSAQQIVNNCAQFGGPECDLITRPSPAEFPSSIRQAPANIAFIETSGVDVDATYHTALGPGDLSVRLFMNYLDKYQTQQHEGAPVLDWREVAAISTSEHAGRPKWSGMMNVSYGIGKVRFDLSEQYVGEMTIGIPGAPSNFIDDDVDPEWYTDATVTYTADTYFGGELEVFGTVNNLFDTEPPLIPSTVPGSTFPTLVNVYDYLGRRFTVGMRFAF